MTGACNGEVRQAGRGKAVHGTAGLGTAGAAGLRGLGNAWHESARAAGGAWRVAVGRGTALRGTASQAWLGVAGRGMASYGSAGQACLGPARQRMAGHGAARQSRQQRPSESTKPRLAPGSVRQSTLNRKVARP